MVRCDRSLFFCDNLHFWLGRATWIARAETIGNDDAMTPEDIMRRLEILRIEHRDLDSATVALAESGSGDQLQVARLKKRKLRLRDEIAALEDMLVPDIIA